MLFLPYFLFLLIQKLIINRNIEKKHFLPCKAAVVDKCQSIFTCAMATLFRTPASFYMHLTSLSHANVTRVMRAVIVVFVIHHGEGWNVNKELSLWHVWCVPISLFYHFEFIRLFPSIYSLEMSIFLIPSELLNSVFRFRFQPWRDLLISIFRFCYTYNDN